MSDTNRVVLYAYFYMTAFAFFLKSFHIRLAFYRMAVHASSQACVLFIN